ncbi:MAG: hypothetical protein JXR12_01275 [Neptunomonas phycophila]|uniref:hypothetical protein n=1 Tax=Neptunomonas phycophila TaxID=1572645 RepID=UPI003B8AF5D3
MAEYSIREERSNAGASALAQGFLTNVFGLTGELTTRILDTIESSGEMPALRQSIKLLPVSSHTKLNQMIGDGEVNGVEDTPFTDEDLGDESMDPQGDEFDSGTDDIDSVSPDQDTDFDADDTLDSMGADQGDLRNNSDADDFSADKRQDSFKESVSSFRSFRENAMMNAKLDAEIASDMDRDLDDQTLKKIKNLEAKGQKDSANQMRKQALRRSRAEKGTQGTRPTERAVLAKKKELARAIQADKQAQLKAGAA